ncbi:TPA: O22 family O-antigen polymerase [Enterobacter hormaechei]
MLNKFDDVRPKGFILLNSAFFIFCLRPPGMSAIIFIITAIALLSLFSNKLILRYETQFRLLYILIFVMMIRCIIGFAFNGGYEERYLPVLLLFSCVLIIHIVTARQADLNECYSGFYYAIILTLALVLLEIITGYHLPSSRYSDPTNDAQLWSISKPTAFYYNENDMLSFLVCFLPFAVYHSKKNLHKIIIFLLTLTSAVYIGSKAAILALLIYLLFTKLVSKKVILLLGAFSSLMLLLLNPSIVEDLLLLSNNAASRLVNFWNTLSIAGADDESTSERLQIYKANIDWLMNHANALLFGNGRFGDYEIDIINQYGLRMGEFHNIHFEMITIYGIIFYMLFFSYYTFLLWRCIKLRHIKPAVRPLITSAVLYPILISFGPSSSLKYPFLFIIVLLMAIGIRTYEKNTKVHI